MNGAKCEHDWRASRIGCLVSAVLYLLGTVVAQAEDGTVQIYDGIFTNFSGALYVGQNGTSNMLYLRNGGRIKSGSGNVGQNVPAKFNSAWVIGAGSVWTNDSMYVGVDGAYNRLTITNGGWIVSGSSLSALGYAINGSNNLAVVTDPGSVWKLGTTLYCGYNGGGCRLVVTNGGVVTASGLSIGSQVTASNNAVLVIGAGSSITSTFSATVGDKGPGNRLDLRDGAQISSSGLMIGQAASASNNVVYISGGSYRMNSGSVSPLEIRQGQLILSNGTISVGSQSLVMTNSAGTFQFLAGTCAISQAIVSNGSPLVVGDGVHAALLQLQPGTCRFADGLVVSSLAALQSTASSNNVVTLNGAVTNYGTFEVTGKLTCSNRLFNAGTLILEASSAANFYGPVVNNGLIITNAGTLNWYGGLTGPGTVLDAAGDADNDGVSNLDEARTGTDPLNPNSFFHVSAVQPNSGDLKITVLCGGGRTIQLEYALAPNGPYSNLGAPVFLAGTGDVTTNLVAPGILTSGPAGFLRVLLSPPY